MNHDHDMARPFEESRRLGVYTTRDIVEGKQPILLVWHDHDGDWQFLTGGRADMGDGIVVHLAHIVERYPEVQALSDLPRGWAAEREAPGSFWRRYALQAPPS